MLTSPEMAFVEGSGGEYCARRRGVCWSVAELVYVTVAMFSPGSAGRHCSCIWDVHVNCPVVYSRLQLHTDASNVTDLYVRYNGVARKT